MGELFQRLGGWLNTYIVLYLIVRPIYAFNDMMNTRAIIGEWKAELSELVTKLEASGAEAEKIATGMANANKILEPMKTLFYTETTLNMICAGLGMISAFLLIKKHPKALSVTKKVLIITVVSLVFTAYILPTFFTFPDKLASVIALELKQYILIQIGVAVAWYLYFTNSDQIDQIYGDPVVD